MDGAGALPLWRTATLPTVTATAGATPHTPTVTAGRRTPPTGMELLAIACRPATPVTVLCHRATSACPLASSRPLTGTTLTRRHTIELFSEPVVTLLGRPTREPAYTPLS